jgi:hypothetical protein
LAQTLMEEAEKRAVTTIAYTLKEKEEILAFYFTISRFFQRRFLPLHFLHLRAVSALRAPQSLQIFM